MIMSRGLALILTFASFTAAAGYECTLKLSRTDAVLRVIAEKKLRVEDGERSSGNLGTLHVESVNGKKQVSLDINALLNGEKNKENATFVILRRTKKVNSILKAKTVSEVMNLKGNDSLSGWFEHYLIDADCEVKE